MCSFPGIHSSKSLGTILQAFKQEHLKGPCCKPVLQVHLLGTNQPPRKIIATDPSLSGALH
jgi:hypothetical protein